MDEEKIKQLDKRIETVEHLIINLGHRTWELCGTDWIKEAAKLIADARELKEPTP